MLPGSQIPRGRKNDRTTQEIASAQLAIRAHLERREISSAVITAATRKPKESQMGGVGTRKFKTLRSAENLATSSSKMQSHPSKGPNSLPRTGARIATGIRIIPQRTIRLATGRIRRLPTIPDHV